MTQIPQTTLNPLGRVLVATDFSPGAEQALRRAALLPLARGAVLTLLHVLAGNLGPALRGRERTEAQYRLGQDAKRLTRSLRRRRAEGPVVRTVVAEGEPFVEIIGCEERAELLVLGRHGRRRFRDLVLGSTAERVIRGGTRPVLVVGRAPFRVYRRPLAAVDLSDSSRRALELAARLAAPGARTIQVVHGYETPYEGMLKRVATAEALSGFARERRALATQALERLLGSVSLGEMTPRIVLRRGDPRQVILAAGRRHRAELIALGTHGRTGIPRLLLGSVAAAVIRHAPGDVLVAPPVGNRARGRRARS